MSTFVRYGSLKSLRLLSPISSQIAKCNKFSLNIGNLHRSIEKKTTTYTSYNQLRQLSSNVEEAPKISKNEDSVQGFPEKKEFQAETRMLLDIVARSLYSDKEVFIRELISNASDALEKFRYLSVSDAAAKDLLLDLDRPLEIKISTDKQNRILVIQDTGIGMTREELYENLGTIARSGSKSFLKEIADKGAEQASSIIGQFGVGFYSAFMVANKIEVFTRSSKEGSQGFKWTSDGSGTYEVQGSEDVAVGTKIVVHLKPECREFADGDTVKGIIKKYSNFIGSAIYLNEERVNSIQPLWLKDSKDVSHEDHVEFYKFISNSYDKPRFILQYKTDAPLSIKSVLYIPEGKPGLFEMSRDSDGGVALYSRKILIQSKADNILPKWLRFVKGVVDSEDIPLNLSRELLQNSNLITKLRTVLTNRILKFLHDKATKDPVEYDHFYKDYSVFLKEGIVISQGGSVDREEIAKLLRFESSQLESGKKISLSEYCSRQGSEQKSIYYLSAPSRALAESSPYYESLKKKNQEVLFCYDAYDELVLLELRQFGGKSLLSVESEMQQDSQEKQDTIIGSDSLQSAEIDQLVPWISSTLVGKVYGVQVTQKLDNHPCVVTVGEMAAARHFIRTQAHQIPEENRYALLQPKLEINPKHSIIKKLHKLMASDKPLAEMVVQQLFSNAMVAAGLVMDPRSLIVNINELLTKALEKH